MKIFVRAMLVGIALLLLPPSSARANYGSGELGDWPSQSHGTWGDLATAKVVIVGDSLTTATWPETSTWLNANGITNAGGYWSGRPTAGVGAAVDWALSLSVKPSILVMATGTNDIMDPLPLTTYIRKLKAGLPATTRLIWVDVQASRPAYPVADQRNSMWVNTQIRTEIPAGDVCGWSIGFASKPSRITAYLKPDGVHTVTGVGDDYRAAVVGGCIKTTIAKMAKR